VNFGWLHALLAALLSRLRLQMRCILVFQPFDFTLPRNLRFG
jgi:hypothetical protein